MQDNQTNRRPPAATKVSIFNRQAIINAILSKSEKKPQGAGVALVSAISRNYSGHGDGRSKTFKANRRHELKLSARRRQRAISRGCRK